MLNRVPNPMVVRSRDDDVWAVTEYALGGDRFVEPHPDRLRFNARAPKVRLYGAALRTSHVVYEEYRRPIQVGYIDVVTINQEHASADTGQWKQIGNTAAHGSAPNQQDSAEIADPSPIVAGGGFVASSKVPKR